ncbi:MAG: transcription termination factor Rho [Acidimicrobiia bacterium]|nr:transcription termination factor Rho [Acidimicrobiia bacterium]
MESTELRRSTLERKDRDELVTIATALGSKPPSRARKSEIVDLIIKTATTDSADEAADDATPTGADASNGSSDEKPEQSSGGARTSNADEPKSDEPAQDAEPVTYHAGDDEFDFGGVTTKGRTKKSSNNDRNAERNKGNGRKNNDRSDNDRNSNDRNSQRNSGGDRNAAEDDDDQSDRGNRRRRRRGRDGVEQVEAEPVAVEGFLDLRDDGYGFLRVGSLRSSKEDAYVSVKQVRQFGLRKGDHLIGTSRPANRNEKNPALLSVDSINGDHPDQAKDRPHFEDLTPLFPDEKLVQERKGYPEDMTARIIDLLSPIGKGQRGLIVSPPKAGKTTIMKNIAQCIERNNPEVQLIVLLLDERPEEVTDMRRSLNGGEVVASTFDRPADEHIALAEITIERAKRMVESGRDVVLIVDGITRLARAYNQAAPANGRVMSGGLDSGAIYPPKKFFGAARNVEEGGSLTILATALVDTGSKMDEVIFEEFKGTGNMELRLDRRAAERRMYPAIDVDASSTRQEQLLFESKEQVDQIWKLRRVLSNMAAESDKGGSAGLELLMDRLATFKTNEQFLKEVAKGV